ncbi:MAG: hypothetical protein R2818_12885 [Flavobacteriales bacterium]
MIRSVTLFACLSLVAITFADSGGPDAYGYTWRDSNEPDGPVYEWIDIVGTGQLVVGLGDDNVVGPFTMITDHPFYWYGRKNIWIGSNGYVAFNNGNIASPFPTIPVAGGVNDYIAALTSDLTFAGVDNPGRCFLLDEEYRTIISYITVPFWNSAPPSYTGSNTFQIILDKLDSTITIQYQNQTGLTNNNDLLIGIESVAGTIGLQHSADIYPSVNHAIRFYMPPQTDLEVIDAAAQWNSNPGNGGQFLSRNGVDFGLSTHVLNTGNQDLSNVQVAGEVRNAANTLQVSSSATIPFLIATLGQDVLFPATFTPATAGTYRYTTTVSGIPNELVASNNTRTQELVVVDTTLTTHDLKFTGNADDGIGLSWDGGNGGVAMYLRPPYYPAYATATTVRIVSNIGASGFSMMVFDDDGVGGQAGTLLDSVYVPPANALPGDLVVPLSAPLTINNGGVYVLWYMDGVNVNIAQDITPPFSLRSYEVLGNTWAEYRDRENVDFHIGLRLAQAPVFDIGCSGFFALADGQQVDAPITIRSWVRNFGNQPASNIPLAYRFNNGPVVTQTYTGAAIQPGQQVLFSFSQQFVPSSNEAGSICAWSDWAPDETAGNDTSCVQVNVSVGMNERAMIDARAWPNPANDGLFVDGLPAGIWTLRLIDAQGRLVLNEQHTAAGAPLRVDLGPIANGAYSLQALSDVRQYRSQVVVQH